MWTNEQLSRLAHSQHFWLTRWSDEFAAITLPYVPGVSCRYRQRKWDDSGWRVWCPEQRYVEPTKFGRPRELFAVSVRLVHMRDGTAAIPEG